MENTWLTYSEALKAARELSRRRRERKDGPGDRFRVMVGGNCNADFLKPALEIAFARDRMAAEIVECDYDAWIGRALSPVTGADAWVIWISAMGLSGGGLVRSSMDMVGITAAFRAILGRGERAVAIMPETLDVATDGFSPFAKWNRAVRRDFAAAVPDGLLCIDPDVLLLDAPYETRHNPSYWSLAKLPCHPNAATAFGLEAGLVLSRGRRQKVKAVIVDLDNTLWGGVVGELGARAVRLDPDGDGRPYLQLQRLLKDISDEGVPLAVVSKNNPGDAVQPFRTRDEMILKESDFVDFIATWDNKYKAIETIVSNLNVGMDTVCFLDDSPHEREEAKVFLPDLIVPDLPEDPDMRPQMLVQSRLFLRPVVDTEDAMRVEYYKDETKRRKLSDEISDWETYLKSLEMRLVARPVSDANLQRATSLIQKTNQFNLTTRRRDMAEIKKMSEDPAWFAYCYALEDRFGSAGIIGVVLAEAEGGGLDLDNWVVSCRVLGRRVEFGMAAHLLQWMEEHGLHTLNGTFIPTERNAPTAGFLSELGLEKMSETKDASKYQAKNLAPPAHFADLVVPNAGSEKERSR